MNVTYRLKNREGLLPAGYAVAKDQLVLNPYKAPAMDLKNVEVVNTPTVAPQIQENDWRYLIINGDNFRLEFNKHTGYLRHYNKARDGRRKKEAGHRPSSGRQLRTMISVEVCSRTSLPGRTRSEADFLQMGDSRQSDSGTCRIRNEECFCQTGSYLCNQQQGCCKGDSEDDCRSAG